jgi:hypothetical protein
MAADLDCLGRAYYARGGGGTQNVCGTWRPAAELQLSTPTLRDEGARSWHRHLYN